MAVEVVGVVEIRDTTVKISAGLVMPEKGAVISVIPTPTPLTKPPEDIIATDVSELVQVTWGVIAVYAVSE
jgi:hypothetical protein